MQNNIEEAWRDYQTDILTDPQYRYSHDHKEIFKAGFTAGKRRETNLVRESIWVQAPTAPDEDPE